MFGMWQALRIIGGILFFFGAPFLVNEYPLQALIIYLPITIIVSILLIYKKIKKKKIDEDSWIYITILWGLIFVIFSFMKAKDDLDIPQFTNGFMYYFPQVLMAVGMFPMMIFLLFPVYLFLGVLKLFGVKWYDKFNAWFDEYIPGELGAKQRGEIIMDIYCKCLFIGRGLATIGFVIGGIFTPID